MREIYLASRYSRYEEMARYADQLAVLGFNVTSRWIHGSHQISDSGLSEQAKESERIRFAQEDWDDLMRAHTVISFTEQPRSSNSRGGRHVEFGAALALGKRCIVVGPRENVFHCLPEVEHFEFWWQAFDVLRTEGRDHIRVTQIEERLRARNLPPVVVPDMPPQLEVRLHDDNTIDEVCIDGVNVHIEQMDTGNWWIGISHGPHSEHMLHLNFTTKRNAAIKLTVMNEGFDATVGKGGLPATSPDYETNP